MRDDETDIEGTEIFVWPCVADSGGLGMHLFWMQFKCLYCDGMSIFLDMEPNTGLAITDRCPKTTVDSLPTSTNIDRIAQTKPNQFTYRIASYCVVLRRIESHFVNKFCDVKPCETCNMNIQ